MAQSSIFQLAEVLEYDPANGLFKWKYVVNNRASKTWFAGSINAHGYHRVRYAGILYQAHRLAWMLHYRREPSGAIDHINGNKTDNRICNLREATISQNTANAKMMSNNKTGVKGIWWCNEKKRYRGQVRFNRKVYSVGSFTSLEEAQRAVEAKRIDLHGQYANNGHGCVLVRASDHPDWRLVETPRCRI